jgi:hypothetical protein
MMKTQCVRTTIDVPAPLYKKLKEQAAAQGRSIRELILAGAKLALVQGKHQKAKRVQFPIIKSRGPKVHITNEQIYEYIEFP